MAAILGLNLHHADSSAALVLDGRLIAAVAEERFGRRLKHDPGFPDHAIRSVLAIGGISAKELDYVAVPRDVRKSRIAKMQYVLRYPLQGYRAAAEHRRRASTERGTLHQVAEACGVAPKSMKAKLVNVEHHLAHIASSYYCSPFESLTAGFSFDGSGDFVSAMAARCEGNRIEVAERVHLPHSLGFFYTACCQFIGFEEFGEEYKVMGLAPYGEDSFSEFMQRMVTIRSDGWFSLAAGFFGMHSGGESGKLDDEKRIVMGRLYSKRWVDEVGLPRLRGAEITQRERDIAKSCQIRFEEAAMHCFRKLHRIVPTNQIAYAGGCALNGVANARLLRDTPFEHVYLQPAASDDGLSVGTALWTWHNIARGRERFYMHHAAWGPEYSEPVIGRAVQSAGMPGRQVARAQVPEVVARLLRAGLVVGWHQGRSEWGPRALGNRSILADPTRPEMKDLINTKIKRREHFRPFAPTVPRASVGKYFEQDVFSPFMMHVVKMRPEWRERLPAVTHVDGTGRLQSIERETNPLYFDLLESFGRLSSMPIVLNTSFNENEPIVDTPEQAVQCFLRTGLDALCVGTYLLVKDEHADELERACSAPLHSCG
jgi:carbamoyltransferase